MLMTTTMTQFSDDVHEPSPPTIPYRDSDYSIGYGQSEANVIPTPTNADSQQAAAEIDHLLRFAAVQADGHVWRRRHTANSLLAQRNRLNLLQLASSTVMVTEGEPEALLTPTSSPDPEPPLSPTLSPGSGVPSPSRTPPTKAVQPEILTEDCILLPSDIEDSETQVPKVFLPSSDKEDDQGPPPSTSTARNDNGSRPSPPCNSSNLPELWSDHPDIFPSPSEIAAALQDPGKSQIKVVKGARQPVTTFPRIQKLCTKLYTQIQTIYKPEGLTKNSTRGRDALVSLILMHRSRKDVTSLDLFFHSFAIGGQVFTITNDTTHCGLDIPVKEYQATIVDQMRKSKVSRTYNDGLRLALTLLDPRYRNSVSLVMANRKDRVHSDISGDFVLHLFEEILVDSFKNTVYKPPQPPPSAFGDIDVEELKLWDPNDKKIFEVDRSASWLLDTWKLYIKKKYKVALDRWNKTTGGGSGAPWTFVNYCDQDARWLVMVFLLDSACNFLLASNAGGRMPNHMQMELGFRSTSPEVSSLESNNTDKAVQAQGKRKAQIEAEKETKQIKVELMSTLESVKSFCKERQEMARQPPPPPPPPPPMPVAAPDPNQLLAQIVQCNMLLNDDTNINSMSPTTRTRYVTGLQARRKRLILAMADQEEGQP